MNRLNIALTLTAIILEGTALIERFWVVLGDSVQAWVLLVVALIPVIPLYYLYHRLNFARRNTGALKYSRFWRDASSVLLGIGIIVPILVASPRVVVSSRLPILVADVDDYTVDRVFAGINTRGLLALALKQSPRLSIFPDERVVETLDRMEKPRNSKITVDVGREICAREELGPLITWRATEAEGSYQLMAQVLDPENGNVLSEVGAGPFGHDAILESIDALGRKLQKQFGDSVLQIRRSTKPLTPATTRSLTALRLYSEARQDLNEYKYDAARAKLLKALEFDSGFALARVELASIHEWQGDTQSAIGCLKQAFERRDSLTEPERVRVSEYYHWLVKNDHEKAIGLVNEFLNRYPRNRDRLGTLASNDYLLMRFDNAVETNRKLLGQPPWRKSSAEDAMSLWDAQLAAGKLDQALETANQILLDMPDVEDNPYMIPITNLALGNTSAVEKQISDLKLARNTEAVLWLGGTLDLYRGKLKDTLNQWSQYIELIKTRDPDKTPWTLSEGRAHLWVARVAILSGDKAEARKQLDQVADVREEIWAEAGKYYARLNDVPKATEVLNDLRVRLAGRITNQNLSLLKLLESEIELAKGNSEASFNLMSQAPEYQWSHLYWSAQETRVRVALASGHSDYAIKICTEMSQRKGFAFSSDRVDDWIMALYFLGAAYEATNRKDLALSSYKEFENLWRDSDVSLMVKPKKQIANRE